MHQCLPTTIDLVIPARNEQDNIAALLGALPRSELRHIVLVDNGSTDQTATLAKAGAVTVVHEPNRGYGGACLAGLAWLANQDGPPPQIVAFLDADLADDPALLPQLCQPIAQGQADLVIGSRPRLAQRRALSWPQRVGNAVACRIIRWITGHRYTDLGPMRAIRWSSLQQLKMADRTWGWTIEMQFKAVLAHLRVMEIDVPYRPRRAGVSKISGSVVGSIRAAGKICWTIVKLWFQQWRSR